MFSGKSTSKIAENKAQETLHFRYLKCLVEKNVGRNLRLQSMGGLLGDDGDKVMPTLEKYFFIK